MTDEPKGLLRYVRFWERPRVADIDDELQFHTDMRVRDYMAHGLSERDARQAAFARLGDISTARDECRAIITRKERRMDRARFIDSLKQDLIFGTRSLRRQRGWTLVAILTIALGIGATTAVFSAVNRLILRPVDFRDADRLVMIWRSSEANGFSLSPSVAQSRAWRGARLLSGVESYAGGTATLTGQGDPRKVSSGSVSETFQQFAGVPLLLGRFFTAADLVKGAAKTVIIGERMWRQDFAGARDVIGRTITLDDAPRTIIGVAPQRLQLPSSFVGQVDLFLPFSMDANGTANTVGRLAPGATVETARAELDSVASRANANVPVAGLKLTTKLVPLGQGTWYRTSLLMLLGAVGLLLLIACANVAHLLLARSAARTREFAIRRALGAGRGRIVSQLLTECIVLVAAGGALGVLIGGVGIRLMAHVRPDNLKQLEDVSLDGRVLAVAAGLTLLAGLLLGIVGAVASTRQTAGDALRNTAARSTQSRGGNRFRLLLVSSEMAISAMLLVGAVLVIRTFANLMSTDPGFDTTGLVTMKFDLPESRYPDSTSRRVFAERMLAAAATIPGVESLTIASGPPPQAGVMFGTWESESGRVAAGNGLTATNDVRPDYFKMMRQRLIDGTTFADGASADDLIISESLAQALFGTGRAVGMKIRVQSQSRTAAQQAYWQTVVGVTPDVAVAGLGPAFMKYAIYAPTGTATRFGGPTLVMRFKGSMRPFGELRAMSLRLDPLLPPPAPLELENALRESVATQRFTMTLLSVFTGLAVLLAAVGLYGVIAFLVNQRTREIGIRMALGARSVDVARLIGAYAGTICAIGLAAGLVGAAYAATALKKMLYGVEPIDPVSFATGAMVLLGIAAVACSTPMLRALRVDPAITMRDE